MSFRNGVLAVLILAVMGPANNYLSAQGIMLSMVGPVNQGMGGAATAAPLEGIGSIYWNPATISAIPEEIGFGLGLLLPDLETSSSITGVGSGTTGSEPGVSALPSVGWVHKHSETVTYGLGLVPIAGFKTNYPASTTNPIFSAQANAPATPGGFGRISSEAAFLQMAPTVSIALSDKLSIGGGPTLTLGEIILDPLVVAAPDDADASGAARYPSGRGTRVHWGGGVALGVYYIHDNDWHLGASLKSPQWFEEFRYHTEDELGQPRLVRFKNDLPMIVSLGAAYSGWERALWAVDVRYFDYKNTDGLGDRGFNPDGSVRGLGWSNIFSINTGLQYKVHDQLYVRGGYTYNQNPFHNSEAALAIAAPLHYQHQIHAGASYAVSDCVWINLGYTLVPTQDISGPISLPTGPIPGSSVTVRETVHLATIGATVRY